MNTQEAIQIASEHLQRLKGHRFDSLIIGKPHSMAFALNLSKVVSKLSPILGNLIEFNTIEFLNTLDEFKSIGSWKRQDPDFPDALFEGDIDPPPGFEIKAWFPLATEITARFKDSQNHFGQDKTHVVMLAWLPENLIFGYPEIIDVCVFSGLSIAEARDEHYHNPPDYLVLEPEDTTSRTRNLQQTNTNGYKWQGNPKQFESAKKIVESWGADGSHYKPTREYQIKLRELIAKYPYRLDTNFAKMDRINHSQIEAFKSKVLLKQIHGKSIQEWSQLLFRGSESSLSSTLHEKFKITFAPENL
ncbi:MAG: hypothetical protein JW806_03185 [Sedimentisphaerales bacterium]|nr:hypothetical protein [Sedimentisphaerales bacterium]